MTHVTVAFLTCYWLRCRFYSSVRQCQTFTFLKLPGELIQDLNAALFFFFLDRNKLRYLKRERYIIAAVIAGAV